MRLHFHYALASSFTLLLCCAHPLVRGPAVAYLLAEHELMFISVGIRSTLSVLKYNGYTYWVWSDSNNDTVMAIVAYDPAGTPVKQWNKTGARYIWQINLNPTNLTVAFVGQANNTITVTWDELFIPAPGPSALTFVNTAMQAVNWVFGTNCSVTVTDSFGAISLPPGVSGSAQLETRTFPGTAGSKGAGKTAYAYRVDLTQAVSGGEVLHIDVAVDFGPDSKLAYDATGQLFTMFVVARRSGHDRTV